MVYHGRIKDGRIVLDQNVRLPEGAEVRVDLIQHGEPPVNPQAPIASLEERLRSFVGKATDLPADLSDRHDYYLYGMPVDLDHEDDLR